MPCCKAEKYGWCSEQDTVYTDKEGNKYCVFHAPEKKGQTEDNFNKLIFKKIQEAIDKKEKCDLSGTIFPWEIAFNYFNKDNPLPELNFSFSIFSGDANFWEAAFSGDADFRNAAFSRIARFLKTAFSREAQFENAAFSGGAYFNGTTFNGIARFGEATFSRIARFMETTFSENAYFDKAAFSGDADFSEAIFREFADFGEAAFSGDADFRNAAFSRIAHFGEATFSGEAGFEFSAFSGEARFENAGFSGDAQFWYSAFSGIANFGKVHFGGRAFFTDTTFSKDAFFRMCSTDELIYFENVDLSHVLFIDSDPLMMQFTNCRWPRIFGRNVLFDEIKMKKEQVSFEKVEYLYRKLKQKYKGEYNEPEVSNWHYGEKEMFRKKLKKRRFNPISFSNLYWASSGYGERPIRAFMVLILLFASVTILMNIFGLVSASEEGKYGVKIIEGFFGVIEWKKFWLLIYNTIQNVLFMKDTFFIPQTIAGVIFLTITTKLIIPIQAALFVLALRNKFRR